jgi:hypothetical protein
MKNLEQLDLLVLNATQLQKVQGSGWLGDAVGWVKDNVDND